MTISKNLEFQKLLPKKERKSYYSKMSNSSKVLCPSVNEQQKNHTTNTIPLLVKKLTAQAIYQKSILF